MYENRFVGMIVAGNQRCYDGNSDDHRNGWFNTALGLPVYAVYLFRRPFILNKIHIKGESVGLQDLSEEEIDMYL